jgi:hypothetical protein
LPCRLLLWLAHFSKHRSAAKSWAHAGLSFFDMDRVELLSRYEPATEESAQRLWDEQYESSLERCSHGAACTAGAGCTQGKRITPVRSQTHSVSAWRRHMLSAGQTSMSDCLCCACTSCKRSTGGVKPFVFKASFVYVCLAACGNDDARARARR